MHEDHVLVAVQNGVELQTDINSELKSCTQCYECVWLLNHLCERLWQVFFLPNQQDQQVMAQLANISPNIFMIDLIILLIIIIIIVFK